MAHAKGKYAKAISDRSGLEFPYNEMIKEWNGSLVHKSEFEARHPQDEPTQILRGSKHSNAIFTITTSFVKSQQNR